MFHKKYTFLLNVVNRILEMFPQDIEIEAQNKVRLLMEKFVLGSIGLSNEEIADLYNNLICLVNFITERANIAQM